MDFQPKIKHKDSKLFYIVFGLFFLMGVASLIFNDPTFRMMGWIVMGFSAIMLFVLWQQNAAFDIIYRVGNNGIFLKRFYMKKLIPYDQILKIEIVNETEAMAVIQGKNNEEIKERNSLSLNAFIKRKEVNEIIKYSSVPVIFTSTTTGIKIINSGVQAKGYFVLLQTTVQDYLITPQKMEPFVNEIQQKMKKTAL